MSLYYFRYIDPEIYCIKYIAKDSISMPIILCNIDNNFRLFYNYPWTDGRGGGNGPPRKNLKAQKLHLIFSAN